MRDKEEDYDNNLESNLITPIQRIPRYELLIKEALKRTNKDYSDYGKLELALTKVIEVNAKNNNSMGQYIAE